MIRRLAFILLVTAATTFGLGCKSAHVNVPTLDGSAASQDPNLEVVRKVEVEALNHVLKRYPPPTDRYAIALPDGTNEATYWWVLRNLPEGAEQLQRLPEDEDIPPIYRVEQIVIRGIVAQVEVVIPPGGIQDQNRLVTVYLSPDTQGWYANRSRLWNVPADRALRKIREQHIEAADANALPEAEALDEIEAEAAENE